METVDLRSCPQRNPLSEVFMVGQTEESLTEVSEWAAKSAASATPFGFGMTYVVDAAWQINSNKFCSGSLKKRARAVMAGNATGR